MLWACIYIPIMESPNLMELLESYKQVHRPGGETQAAQAAVKPSTYCITSIDPLTFFFFHSSSARISGLQDPK
jgi:hypothetical protein